MLKKFINNNLKPLSFYRMKKIVSIMIIVFVSLNLNAQEKTTEKDSVKKSSIDSSKVKTLDSTIKTL